MVTSLRTHTFFVCVGDCGSRGGVVRRFGFGTVPIRVVVILYCGF